MAITFLSMSFAYVMAFFALKGLKTKRDLFSYILLWGNWSFYSYAMFQIRYLYKSMLMVMLVFMISILFFMVINNLSLVESFFLYTLVLIMVLPAKIIIDLLSNTVLNTRLFTLEILQTIVYIFIGVTWMVLSYRMKKIQYYIKENRRSIRTFGWISISNLVYLGIYESELVQIEVGSVIFFLYLFMLALYFFINIYLFVRYIEYFDEYNIDAYRQKFTSQIIPLTEEIRANRHEILNMVNVLQISDSYESLMDRLKSNRQIVEYFGDPVLNGILHRKIIQCERDNIKIHIDVDGQFAFDNIEKYEVISVLINLIDNAIEAIQSYVEWDNSERSIELCFVDKVGYKQISICNSGKMLTQKELEFFLKPGVTTKKIANDHGYGLVNVEQVVKKYNGSIYVDERVEKKTCIIVMLGVDKCNIS